MSRSPFVRWLLLLLALIATACANAGGPAASGTGSPSGPGASGPSAGQPSSPSSPSGPAAVPEILDFEATLVGGGTLRGADLAGAPIAIWFWAPW